MWKSYLLYSICVFTLLASCNKEDIKLDATTVIDWFAVQDKPGELGHLLHKIYEETGISIFVNDTLGYVEDGIDANGEPVRFYETVSEKYLIYSMVAKDIRFVLSQDTVAMLKAAYAIEKWVLPNLPSSGEYRLKSLLLVDSLLTEDYGGDTIREGGKTAWVFEESIETTPVGKLADIKNMDESTLKFWAGMVLSAKVYIWLNSHCSDSLSIFYKMTNLDLPKKARTLYNLHDYKFFRMVDTGEEIDLNADWYYGAELWDHWRMGFLEWGDTEWSEIDPNNSNKEIVHRKALEKPCDAMNYIAAVYAFSDEEFKKLFSGVEYSEKCIQRRLYMKKLVELFHDANGVTCQPF
ncbi:hypothetical protein [Butyricimonas paravirosa]